MLESPADCLCKWVSVKGVSSKGTFEAGFFRSAGTESWFLGIWYKNVAERTYVWVEERVLLLHQQQQLLENGNLVLKDVNNDNPEDFFWQSFDEPTDTILPEMKLLWNYQNRYLTSWRALDDPRPGNYVFRFETPQYPVLSIWYKAFLLYRSGPWNGYKFIGAPSLFRLEWKDQQISYLSINTTTTSPDYTRVQLDNDGSVRHYTLESNSQKVGPAMELIPLYSERLLSECIPGFEFGSLNVTTKECVQKKNGTCNGDDHFSLVRKMNLPDSRNAKSNPSITKPEQCGKICLGDCTCTAYSISISLETDNWSCITWSRDLLDLRSYFEEGLDLYVRTAGKKKSKTGLIVGTCVCILVVLALLPLFCYWRRKKKRERERATTAASSIGK
uniref:Apple domain-containing protein n=1 Tax=Brassica oleracea var. oleracea TaxID=109376 RepID=A0A0D3C9C2_BRAOL